MITEGDTTAVNKELYRHFKVSVRILSDPTERNQDYNIKDRITNIHKDGRWMDDFYPIDSNDLKYMSL